MLEPRLAWLVMSRLGRDIDWWDSLTAGERLYYTENVVLDLQERDREIALLAKASAIGSVRT